MTDLDIFGGCGKEGCESILMSVERRGVSWWGVLLLNTSGTLPKLLPLTFLRIIDFTEPFIHRIACSENEYSRKGRALQWTEIKLMFLKDV